MDPPLTLTDADADGDAFTDDGDPQRIGRFAVVGRLGSGGMGTVFAAYDPQLDRKVALKLLHAPRHDSSRHTHARARLLREAQAIAKVTHPNVIHVYEVGVVPLGGEDRVFLAMELVEGPTMRGWMKTLHATDAWKDGRAWPEVVDVIMQAGRGLAAAHAVGLMHRDFKPDNVLIGDDGLVRVVDFGLARRVRDEDDSAEAPPANAVISVALDERLTVTGAVLGTPAYMAPEQFRGERTDERTDQFALCLTLYEALLGVRPFHSETGQGLACAVMMGELRPWPTRPPVPDHLVRIIERGLSKEPEDRFGSIGEVVDALGADPRRVRRRRLAWLGGALALLTATSVGAVVTRRVTLANEDPCDAGPTRVAEQWNAQRAQALRAALSDPDLPYAEKTIDSVVAGLDAYGGRWAEQHRDACEATHVRNEQTGELLDRRMACLERRLTALDATVTELLRDDEPSLLRDAQRVVGGLPALAPCANTTALQGVAPPADAATRDATAAARRQMDIAGAKAEAHRYAETRELLLGLRERVVEIGYAPLHAEYLLELALAEDLAGNPDTAITEARQALLVGQATGHDAIVRDAAARLASLLGLRKAKREEGLLWADLAEATAQRVGWTDAKRADLLRNRAWLLVEWGLSREAIDVAEQALAAAKRAHGADSLLMAGVHSSVGSVYGRLREMPKAETHFVRVVELYLEHLGEDHPDLISAYLNLGNALSAQGELERARQTFDRSIELAERLPDVGLATRARTQSSLGNLLANEKRFEEALAPHQRALELREELYGPEHPLVGRSLLSLGNAYTNLDRVQEATDAYERSLRIRERANGADSPSLVLVLDNLGMHLVRHGDPSAGLRYLQRSDAILKADPQDAYRHADHTYWLGRALVETAEDRAGGLQLVDQAIVELEDLGNVRLRRDAKAWRADHP